MTDDEQGDLISQKAIDAELNYQMTRKNNTIDFEEIYNKKNNSSFGNIISSLKNRIFQSKPPKGGQSKTKKSKKSRKSKKNNSKKSTKKNNSKKRTSTK